MLAARIRQRGLGALSVPGLCALALAAGLASGPYLAWWLGHGSPAPMTEGLQALLDARLADAGPLPEHLSPGAYVLHFLTSLLVYWPPSTPASRLELALLAAPLLTLLLCLAGVVLAFRAPASLPPDPTRALVACGAIALIVLMLVHFAFAYGLHLETGWHRAVHPRYYFPALPILPAAFALLLMQVRSARVRGGWPAPALPPPSATACLPASRARSRWPADRRRGAAQGRAPGGGLTLPPESPLAWPSAAGGDHGSVERSDLAAPAIDGAPAGLSTAGPALRHRPSRGRGVSSGASGGLHRARPGAGLGPWGICGVSLRRPDVRDRLAPQDGLYTVAERDGDGARLQVIGCLKQLLVAPEDPGAVVARIAAPESAIVSLTVTEKGYCHDPASGRLDWSQADIVHDLAEPLRPRSAVGMLVAGLARRRSRQAAPPTVLSCDNLPANGRTLRGLVIALAARRDEALARWIEARGRVSLQHGRSDRAGDDRGRHRSDRRRRSASTMPRRWCASRSGNG